MTARLSRLLLLCGLVLIVSVPAASQTTARRPLTHDDYAAWRTISAPTLSPDGSLIAYAVVPLEGDGEVVVRQLGTGKEFRTPRGSQSTGVPPVAVRAAGRGGRGGAATTPSQHLFSPDGKFVLFPLYPPRPDKSKGKAPPATTPAALGILEVASGKVTRIEKARNYQVPEEGAPWLAYIRGSATSLARTGPAGKGAGSKTPADKAAQPQPTAGADLVLRNLADGRERTFAEVTEYRLSRDGRCLLFAVDSKKPESNGLYAITPGQETPPQALARGAFRFSRLTWDDKQSRLAFFRSTLVKPGSDVPRPEVRLFCWVRPATGTVTAAVPPLAGGLGGVLAAAHQATSPPPAVELAPGDKPAFQAGHQVSNDGTLEFSSDGNRVYFSVAPPPPPKPAAPTEGKAQVELWHFNDDFIQPMQKARSAGRNRSYRAVYHLADRSCRQLADDALPDVLSSPSADWALGRDDRPYRRLVGGSEASTPYDYILVNQRSGARQPLLKKQTSGLTFSPSGKYLLTFDGKDWHSLSVPTGKKVNLTARLKVRFDNELHDTPSTPAPYGDGGWTKGDSHVLLYDRCDIWLVAADGSSARNLTAGLGCKTGTQLRPVRLEPRQQGIDLTKPLLLRAENLLTRDTGFYRLPPGGGPPKLLLMGARSYNIVAKAKKADGYLLTVSTFYDYPDLFVADGDFREIKRVSDANPGKAKLVWGKAELVRYKSLDGTPLQGILVRPENFDPGRKYPMIVYLYERLSQNLHRFVEPRPGTSINASYYASNGYLVLMPDIAYGVGQPGQSALKCVLPAIQAVVDQGGVDEKAIGIQGHSWGGYQAAYLVTQTTRFKAAAAGAPVCNMTSAYGGVRWGSGMPRQFQYEKTQSRIGGSLWQYPTRFVENSPLFHADRIQTPLLMLHNDKDEAVPWQQGIEYYLALRRLGKEVYLFNYPGEGHGLRQRVNQADYTVRMQQFFDHHLKGAAKPEWMAKGLPYTPPPSGTGTTPTRGRRSRR